MKELPKRAYIIAICVLLGQPIIEWYDRNYGLAVSIRMRTYYDEAICEQYPDKCWIKLKKETKK